MTLSPLAFSVTELFDQKLPNFGNFMKIETIMVDDVFVITYYDKEKNITVDVVDEECVLSTKNQDYIYTFYDDDFEEVVDDVCDDILCVEYVP